MEQIVTTKMPESFQQILGVRFFTGDLPSLVQLTKGGGLVVVPSAPVLVDLNSDEAHREALENSDLALADSGFMVLLWRIIRRQRLPRISGLRYLRALLPEPELHQPNATFWIMPSIADAGANRTWLKEQGLEVRSGDCYIAPIYPSGFIEDPILLALLENAKPRYIFINLGGGVQERLGYYLRRHLSAFAENRPDEEPIFSQPIRPAIICTGAAIAFLSGQQANIPPWADRLVLGWLMRTIQDPKRFVPRYVRALRLVPLLLEHGTRGIGSAK